MMILSTSISVGARRSTAARSSTQCVAADDVFHSLLHASRDCARCGLGCLSRALLTMLRGYPVSRAVRALSTICRWTARSGSSSASSVVLTGFQPVAGAKCSELQSARKIATCGVWREPRRKSPAEICQIAGLDESIGGQNLCNPAQVVHGGPPGRTRWRRSPQR
jgi:hypothetical protein